MATLLEVAQRLGQLTSVKAPKKTGNLKRRLREVNTGRNILGGLNSAQAERQIIDDLKTGTFTFSFEVDVAPEGAEYGQWWNDPTVSKTVKSGKTKNVPDKINFFDQAYNSPEFQQMLNEYTDTLADKIALSIGRTIEEEIR